MLNSFGKPSLRDLPNLGYFDAIVSRGAGMWIITFASDV